MFFKYREFILVMLFFLLCFLAAIFSDMEHTQECVVIAGVINLGCF